MDLYIIATHLPRIGYIGQKSGDCDVDHVTIGRTLGRGGTGCPRLGRHAKMLRKGVREAGLDPQPAFPGNGQMQSEQKEDATWSGRGPYAFHAGCHSWSVEGWLFAVALNDLLSSQQLNRLLRSRATLH